MKNSLCNQDRFLREFIMDSGAMGPRYSSDGKLTARLMRAIIIRNAFKLKCCAAAWIPGSVITALVQGAPAWAKTPNRRGTGRQTPGTNRFQMEAPTMMV
jgi:hypothetical protein